MTSYQKAVKRNPTPVPVLKEVDYHRKEAGPFETVLFITDSKRQILNCNPQITALCGYAVAEVLNHDYLDFLQAPYWLPVKSLKSARHPAPGLSENGQPGLIAKDGSIIPVQLKAQTINWYNHAADLVIMTRLPPSPDRRESFRRQDRRPPVPEKSVISLDSRGFFVFINEPARRLIGLRGEEIIGKDLKQTVAPEFRPQIGLIFERIRSNQTWTGIIPVVFPDGAVIPFSIRLCPVVDRNNDLVSIIGIFRDQPSKQRNDATAAVVPAADSEADSRGQLPSPNIAAAINQAAELENLLQIVRVQVNQLVESISKEENLIQRMNSLIQSVQAGPMPQAQSRVAPDKIRLEVYSLGAFRVCSRTRHLQHWQSNRAKSVFQYLVSKHSAPVSRDILTAALWPDYGTREAANSLKTAIHDLRQDLATLFDKTDLAVILYSHEGYLINPDIELLIDAETFELFWNRGKQLEKETKTEEAMRNFEKAETFYQGDYLEDSLYEEWTISRRETLKDIYLLIINKLADHAMSQADYENCITYCHRILEKDNCREDAYRMLMSCYSRLRQKNNALRWYDNCRQTLLSELGVPPSQETVTLFNRLKKDETV